MKIAIISDWHLGYNWNNELKNDSFDNVRQAFTQIKEKDVDLILFTGDLFDKKEPSYEVFYEAIKLFNEINIENKIGLKAKGVLTKIPLIAIVGNHEFKGKEYKSAIELLELMGYLKFINFDKVEIGNVAVYGMSGHPEIYALDILKKWNPQPVSGKYNILLLHQSIKEYLPFEDEMIATISLTNLPKGFDAVIDGHLHWSAIEKINDNSLFILPGSTITTQLKKKESEKKKGFYILNSETKDIDFYEINNIRETYYIDLKFDNDNYEKIEKEINEKLENIPINNNKKPLVRIRLKGNLKDSDFIKNIKLEKIKEKFTNINITIKNEIKEKSLKESVEELKQLNSNKNISEIIRDIFLEQIKQTNISKDIDYLKMFELLKDDKKTKDVYKILME